MKIKRIFSILFIFLLVLFMFGCVSDNQADNIFKDIENTDVSENDKFKESLISANSIDSFLDKDEAVKFEFKQYTADKSNITDIYCLKNDEGIWFYSDNTENHVMFVLTPEFYYTSNQPYDEVGFVYDSIKTFKPLDKKEYDKMSDEYNVIISDWLGGENSKVTRIEEREDSYFVTLTEQLDSSNLYGSYYRQSFGIENEDVTIVRVCEAERDTLKIRNVTASFVSEDYPETVEYEASVVNINDDVINELIDNIINPTEYNKLTVVKIEDGIEIEKKIYKVPSDAENDFSAPDGYSAYSDAEGIYEYEPGFLESDTEIYLIRNKKTS